MESTRTKRAGRPAGGDPEAVRAALLDAARAHFTERSFRAVSVRELARSAGVNPAMVNYYFGGKEGLYTAMIEATVGPLLEQLEASDAAPDLSQFLERYIRTLAANPWLPNLVVREVLYGEARFRETFIQRFARRMGAALPELVRTELNARRLRGDLDPALTVLSLLSMALFPFVARPLAERALEISLDEEAVDRLVEHTRRLFYEGAGSTGSGDPAP